MISCGSDQTESMAIPNLLAIMARPHSIFIMRDLFLMQDLCIASFSVQITLKRGVLTANPTVSYRLTSFILTKIDYRKTQNFHSFSRLLHCIEF